LEPRAVRLGDDIDLSLHPDEARFVVAAHRAAPRELQRERRGRRERLEEE